MSPTSSPDDHQAAFQRQLGRMLLCFFAVASIDVLVVSFFSGKLRCWFPAWIDPRWQSDPDSPVVYSQSYIAGILFIPLLAHAIERAFRAALPRYQMRHYAGKLILFRPKLDEAYVLGEGRVLDSMKEWVSHDNAFGPYADSVEVYEVPGNHDSMVLGPNVRVMASRLRDCIAEAGSAEGGDAT